jgi:hypothetical protein
MVKYVQQISCLDVDIESAGLVLADRCGSVEATVRGEDRSALERMVGPVAAEIEFLRVLKAHRAR